jgi:hypothetical protein
MTDSGSTLQAVFASEKMQISDTDREDLEQEEDILSIKHSIVEDFSDRQWQVVVSHLGETLAGCLDIGIPDILLSAWRKTNELARYCDKQQYPPGEAVLVPLAEHTVESEHHPAIEILIRNKRVGKVSFTVKLKLKVEGMILKVQDCRIMSLTTGTCEASGSIQLKNLALAEVETRKISLPGRVDLGEGIPIAG